jgi:hypothetical protein
VCTRNGKAGDKNRMPDKKITPGSREICSANSGNEARFSNIAAAIATSVGPIRPAINFDVELLAVKRRDE